MRPAARANRVRLARRRATARFHPRSAPARRRCSRWRVVFCNRAALCRASSTKAIHWLNALLAEPTAVQTAPERLALARDVLDALVRIRFGEDSQVVLKLFGKVDMLTVSTVMERVCDQLIRAQFRQPTQHPINAVFSAPYPTVRLLYHYKERIAEVRTQSQARIIVNSGLALGSLFAAWAFMWTRGPR